jgi:hypothetical protein
MQSANRVVGWEDEDVEGDQRGDEGFEEWGIGFGETNPDGEIRR